MRPEKVFVAMMRSRGYTDEHLKMVNGKYANPVMQTRWNYFLAGWEMRGAA